MITETQAAHIASRYHGGDPPRGAAVNSRLFVFTFDPPNPSDHYDNLTVAVDRHTGQVRSLGTGEFLKIQDSLQEI